MIQGCGAKAIKEAIQEELGIGNHNDELTVDKMFSYEEVKIFEDFQTLTRYP